ncbi:MULTISPECIES: hypothetical protein [Bacillota]|uniref:hypothetical protein n=1 Tax=Bacillota TaxID=1239 RepID=UPI0039EE40EA
MTKRKPKFSVVTNEMSDETYKKMEKLVNKRLFSQAVIDLFESKDQHEKILAELKNEIETLKKTLLQEITKVSKQISNIKVAVPGTELKDTEEASGFSIAPEFTEGDEVKGKIEEDIDLDF